MAMSYTRKVLIAWDQLGNALIGGEPDETLSSRAYRADLKGTWWGKWTRPMIDWIFRVGFKEADHCFNSYKSEMWRRHLPTEFQMKR